MDKVCNADEVIIELKCKGCEVELTPDNTYAAFAGYIFPRCKECQKIYNKEYRKRKNEPNIE